MIPGVDVEADAHNRRRRHRTTTTIATTANISTRLATRTRLALSCIFCFCLWVFATTPARYFAPGARDDNFSPTSSGHGIHQPGVQVAEGVGASSGGSTGAVGGGRGSGRGPSGEDSAERDSRRPPRILTVLTTYGKRSGFVKPYKEVVSGRNDGYRPTVFAVSNEEDKDPDGVVDFKTASWRQHRLLAALAEACSRYAGSFDWLAIGDDDTAFLYNRAASFLSHIDHLQPVAFGVVDGLNPNAAPCSRRKCFSPEQKRNASDFMAASGCCDDFASPCEVPVFPERVPPPDEGRNYSYADYGGGGLFWPFGGAGFFVSGGFVDVIGGSDGFLTCVQMFGHMNTDVQVAACLKLHGYSVGLYTEGFSTVETADPAQIQETLASNCQTLGVHLGIRHLADGSTYTPEAFRAAIAAVQDVDTLSLPDGADLETFCPQSLANLLKYKVSR